MNTFENSIMENGAFAPDDECSMFHNIFKYMFFQSRQKALLWSKALNHAFTNYVISTKNSCITELFGYCKGGPHECVIRTSLP